MKSQQIKLFKMPLKTENSNLAKKLNYEKRAVEIREI